jgi:hypothetical protein
MTNYDQTFNQPASAEVIHDNEASDDSLVSSVTFDPEAMITEEDIRSKETARQWLRRNQLKIAIGSYAVSLSIGFMSNPAHIEEKVLNFGPWAGGVYAASEIVWAGGMALGLSGAGSKIGNPLTLKKRWDEIKDKASDNKTIRSGMVISGIGGLGIEAAIVTGAVAAKMPSETWAVLGPDVLLGVGSTIWPRKIALDRMKANRLKRAELDATQPDESEVKTTHKISVRKARLEDAERLAEIGKSRYRRTSIDDEESDEEAKEMFEKRIMNATSQWAYVCEVDGRVEGSAIGFRTNKPWEDFVSWEESTTNGTLEGQVDPEGKYVYVANMTVNPKATAAGGVEMVMANMLAEAIKEGVEYGYFVSRIPLFASWLKRYAKKNGTDVSKLSPEQLDQLAQDYVNLHEEVDGKKVRSDYELRLYEASGFEMGRLVRDAYTDPMSLNYGVLFKAPVPPNNVLKKVKPVRYGLSAALKAAARYPKLLERML